MLKRVSLGSWGTQRNWTFGQDGDFFFQQVLSTVIYCFHKDMSLWLLNPNLSRLCMADKCELLDTSENLVTVRMPSWPLSSFGQWVSYTVQFPPGQRAIVLYVRASRGGCCGREEGENLITERQDQFRGGGNYAAAQSFRSSLEPWVFPVLLAPPASSNLSPVWKSNWGSWTITTAEASRGKDWEYCWQRSWEYYISSVNWKYIM